MNVEYYKTKETVGFCYIVNHE